MADPMRIRATEKGGKIEVKILMKHDMDTGLRKDSNGDIIPGHYITDLMVKNKGTVVFQGHFGPSVSKDPYLSFRFKGAAKGDTLVVSWADNKGDSREDKTTIK